MKELRAARGLTQDQFSEALSIDPSYLRRIENGRINLGVRKLVRVAELLGCASVMELFEVPQGRAARTGRPRRPRATARTSAPTPPEPDPSEPSGA